MNAPRACWAEYESKRTLCVEGDQVALAKAVLKTYNTVIAPDVATANAAKEQAVAAGVVSPAATYILGVVYDGQSYTGYSYTFTTTISSPCSTHFFTVSNLEDYHWNLFGGFLSDRIESHQPGPGCKIGYWVDVNQMGSYSGLLSGNKTTLSAFNNQASSMWFSG